MDNWQAVLARLRDDARAADEMISGDGDQERAFTRATELGAVAGDIETEAGRHRARAAARWAAGGMSLRAIGRRAKLSKSRAAQLVDAGRALPAGPDTGDRPVPLPVAVALIASPGRGVLTEPRPDGSWRFPAAEVALTETPAAALRRVVPAARPLSTVGAPRVHPGTGRLMIYMECDLDVAGRSSGEYVWLPVADVLAEVPDMYAPAAQLLRDRGAAV